MAFSYQLPIFNITANIWRATSSLLDPPDVVTPAQLYFYSRSVIPLTPGDDNVFQPTMLLRVPKGTSLEDGDQIEAAAGDAWFYRCRWVDRVHRGFPNEYLVGVLEHPGGSGPIPNGIVTESGVQIITESGVDIFTE